MTEITEVFSQGVGLTLAVKNGCRWLGSILVEMTGMDDCFLVWDGHCLGTRLGTAAKYVLDTSILEWDSS